VWAERAVEGEGGRGNVRLRSRSPFAVCSSLRVAEAAVDGEEEGVDERGGGLISKPNDTQH
jgi:hypothetical protein